MRTASLALLLSFALSAASQPRPDKSALEGRWKAVAAVLNGKELKKQDKELYFTAAGRTFIVKEGAKVVARGTFTTDSNKRPRQIEFTINEGPRALKGLTLYGIYEVKGQTLRWCVTSLGADERPSEFQSAEDSGFLLVTLNRRK
jgi:uncharacterized protein (TIGR03067 family)